MTGTPFAPRLTRPLLLWGLVGLAGMAAIVLGALGLFVRPGLLLAGFPATLAEGVAALAGGGAVVYWALHRVLREIARQAAE